MGSGLSCRFIPPRPHADDVRVLHCCPPSHDDDDAVGSAKTEHKCARVLCASISSAHNIEVRGTQTYPPRPLSATLTNAPPPSPPALPPPPPPPPLPRRPVYHLIAQYEGHASERENCARVSSCFRIKEVVTSAPAANPTSTSEEAALPPPSSAEPVVVVARPQQQQERPPPAAPAAAAAAALPPSSRQETRGTTAATVAGADDTVEPRATKR